MTGKHISFFDKKYPMKKRNAPSYNLWLEVENEVKN